MSRRRKDPLRPLTDAERSELGHRSRSRTSPAASVARAVLLPAVAGGSDYQTAARSAGRRSGDAVSHLVARFHAEGRAALEPRRGGGRAPRYTDADRARILREAARPPTPEADGTATGSLALLRRVPRAAPDGLPAVSTFPIGQTLRDADSTFPRPRTWCPTGRAVRRRKAGTATVTDPDAAAKKNRSGTRTRSENRSACRCGARPRPAPSRPSPVPGHPDGRRGSRPARRPSPSATARPRS